MKNLSILLTIAMMLSLLSCSSDEPTPPDTSDGTTTLSATTSATMSPDYFVDNDEIADFDHSLYYEADSVAALAELPDIEQSAFLNALVQSEITNPISQLMSEDYEYLGATYICSVDFDGELLSDREFDVVWDNPEKKWDEIVCEIFYLPDGYSAEAYTENFAPVEGTEGLYFLNYTTAKKGYVVLLSDTLLCRFKMHDDVSEADEETIKQTLLAFTEAVEANMASVQP